PDAPAPPAFPFTAVPAVNLDTTDEWSILQYFEAFLDDGLITHIVNETNRYADQKKRVYRKCGGNKSALVYRMDLIQQIMEKYHQTEFSCRRGRPSANLTPLRLTGRHFPEYIPATEKKKNPTRQCGICSRVRDARGKKNPQRNSLLLPRL
ncbi:hypothetical protein NQ318_005160, partial [Aromia moschata]